ncbi:MAG TPA: hypothetical protein VM240_14910 [Verrucomicrobiae bacterium]|nr:hypothetical protein [Verrucomicrobiae bacterium]
MKVAVALLHAALATAIVLPAIAQAQAKKIQCWTDNKGQRMCGDRVPPEYAGNRRDVVKDGRVIATVKAAATPEELAEARRKKQEADDAARQADYDRALMQTYRSSKDIESMRDERIALLDSRIAAAEKNSVYTDQSLTDLRARAARHAADGKPVDEKLAKQIKQYERDQKQNAKSLERNRNERAEIETKFNSDLARFNALRGKPAATPAQSAAPPPPPKG